MKSSLQAIAMGVHLLLFASAVSASPPMHLWSQGFGGSTYDQAEAILERPVIEQILGHMGEPTAMPPVSPARAPPQATFDFDQGAGLPEWPDMDQTAKLENNN